MLNILPIESHPTQSRASEYSKTRRWILVTVINTACHLFLIPGSTEHGTFTLLDRLTDSLWTLSYNGSYMCHFQAEHLIASVIRNVWASFSLHTVSNSIWDGGWSVTIVTAWLHDTNEQRLSANPKKCSPDSPWSSKFLSPLPDCKLCEDRSHNEFTFIFFIKYSTHIDSRSSILFAKWVNIFTNDSPYKVIIYFMFYKNTLLNYYPHVR